MLTFSSCTVLFLSWWISDIQLEFMNNTNCVFLSSKGFKLLIFLIREGFMLTMYMKHILHVQFANIIYFQLFPFYVKTGVLESIIVSIM
jgi:hypothetical protein